MPLVFNCETYSALCRMPNKHVILGIKSKERRLYTSLNDIPEDASGFIVAPFLSSRQIPTFLFEGIETTSLPLPQEPAEVAEGHAKSICSQEKYATAFEYIKRAIDAKTVQKAVLARSEDISGLTVDINKLFIKACHTYPHCYVALVDVPGHGQWLTATPELLYKTDVDHMGHTTALAGTMPWTDIEDGISWSGKNLEEQRMVEEFIMSQLKNSSISFTTETPHTVKAGNLAHLKTDFTLDADNHSPIEIIRLLHPTPAVAGVPRNKAIDIIIEAEGADFRQYYAGFTGFINNEEHHTACFVSLRLLCSKANNLTLYAGGGILPQSSMNQEWSETKLKLGIMKRLLGCQKHTEQHI